MSPSSSSSTTSSTNGNTKKTDSATKDPSGVSTATASGHCQATQLPSWILVWFYVTAVVCTWDATFIMLRPHTLPGGYLAWIWYPYKYYVVVDQRYNDTEDAYVFAQSLMNYVEVIVNIITIFMHYKRSVHTSTTAFMVSVMTFWKTVLYFLMFSEFCTGGFYRKGNTLAQEFFLVVIPNVIWVILPLAAMIDLWPVLTPANQPITGKRQSETNGSNDSKSSKTHSENASSSKVVDNEHGNVAHMNLRSRKINVQ